MVIAGKSALPCSVACRGGANGAFKVRGHHKSEITKTTFY